MCSGRTGSMARALSGQKPWSHGAVGTTVSAAGVTAVPRCLEAWGHCTSSHRPRAKGDDLFLEMFTQFLSLQRGWGVCLRAGSPVLPRCRGQRAGAPHLLSPGSRGTSTPTASSPMTRGCSPCRWVQGGVHPRPWAVPRSRAWAGCSCGGPRVLVPLLGAVPAACGLFSVRAAGCGRLAATPSARGRRRLPPDSTTHPDTVPSCH